MGDGGRPRWYESGTGAAEEALRAGDRQDPRSTVPDTEAPYVMQELPLANR
jgi:hypothetical protein